MKKCLSLILAVLLAVNLMAPAMAADVSFSDVPADAWYAEAVAFVASEGLFEGTSKTTFSPGMTMSRGMFVLVLSRLAGADVSAVPSAGFTDVPEGKWYTDAVSWAYTNGYVNGSSGRFYPDEPITREQIAQMLYNYLTRTGTELADADGVPGSFSDSGSVSSWARDGVEYVRRTGLMLGNGGSFAPSRKLTRAEAATVFMRVFQTLASTGSDTVTGITLSATEIEVDLYSTVQLYAYVTPSSADAKISWSSSDADIAAADSNGQVTGMGEGTAIITASAGGVSASCVVTVVDEPMDDGPSWTVIQPEITVTPTRTSPSQNRYFIGKIEARNCGHDVTEGHFNYQSSDESVIEIVGDGYLYGLVYPGEGKTAEASITVTHTPDGTTRQVKVTVTAAIVTYYEINDEYIAAYAAEMLRLVNEARAQANAEGYWRNQGVEFDIGPLVYAEQEIVQRAANSRSQELATNFSHSENSGYEDFGAENIAKGTLDDVQGNTIRTSPEALAKRVFDAWMNHKGHQETILLPIATKMVVGLYIKDGWYYSAQWFSDEGYWS